MHVPRMAGVWGAGASMVAASGVLGSVALIPQASESPPFMCRTDLPVSVGMEAVAPCTFPEWRACGGLGHPWLWRRVCLVLWPSYLTSGPVSAG